MTIFLLAHRIRPPAVVRIAGRTAAVADLLAVVAGAGSRWAGRSCRSCCEACWCCCWRPAWPDRRRPGPAASRSSGPSGRSLSLGLAAALSNSPPRTTSAPANRFRSRPCCDRQGPARPPWNCFATDNRCRKRPSRCRWLQAKITRPFPTSCPNPSRVVYSLRVKDEHGAWPDDNPSACAVHVDPPPRALLVESQAVLAEHLKKALAGENVVVEVQPELPAGELAAYDLIILSNVPAAALPEERMKALQSFVARRPRRADRGGRRPFIHGRRLSAYDAGGHSPGDLCGADEQAQADAGDGLGAGHLRHP